MIGSIALDLTYRNLVQDIISFAEYKTQKVFPPSATISSALNHYPHICSLSQLIP